MRVDIDGNVWAAAGWAGPGDDRRSHLCPRRHVASARSCCPKACANVCFGGPKRNRLFMTASQSLYALYVNTRGAHAA